MTVKRIRFLQELLKFIGLEGRLHLEWISSAEAEKFVRVVTDFTAKIRQLGPNPLPGFSPWTSGTAVENQIGPTPPARSDTAPASRYSRPGPDVVGRVKSMLGSGEIDAFLGYRLFEGHALPHQFTGRNLEEVDQLVIGLQRYSLEALAVELLAAEPETRIGLLARDCNQRALGVLRAWDRLDADRIRTVNLNCCPGHHRGQADCGYLKPERAGAYKRRVGIDGNAPIEAIEQMAPEDRLSRWMYEFQKCIKCYGCRNVCPVCFCKDCSLQHPELIPTGSVPPETPLFHLVRAVHMAGRCIDCGLCEEACPVGIPLRLLYRKANQIVADLFDYEAGTDDGLSPFGMLDDKVVLEPLPLQAAGGQ